ncbi:hypothetical protein [Pollutibacter soli]|uniref:hypothetical protein n=1 Tax=Pollutibacter soli TaxID=3034157 RepID=UPI0030131FE8
MKINRENYEEYFILYADNELKLAERNMVEEFVAIHSDLKEEFDMMLQMKLDPEDQMAFPDKGSLFKPIELQDDQFQPEPGQLEMLMYMDNELEEEERLKFEKKLKSDKKIREELDIFLNARAEPDFKVVFPDKALLYRHTEKSAPIFRITWVRVAVAAAVILIAGLLWLNRSDSGNSTIDPTVYAKNDGNEKVEGRKADQPESKKDSSAETTGVADNQRGSFRATDESERKQETNRLVAGRNTKDNAEKTTTIKKVTGGEKPSNHLAVNRVSSPDPLQKNITTPDPGNPIDKNEINTTTAIAKTSPPNITDRPEMSSTASFASANHIKTNYATDALLHGDDETAERTTQLTEEEKPRKGALRGFFRKANRVLNRVTNPDQGPASVRVAGFEIASAQ